MGAKQARSDRGFTLIEVLFAITILTTMVLLTVGTTTSSFRLRTQTLDSFESKRVARQAVDRASRELSMAFMIHPQAMELLEQASEGSEVRYRTIFKGDDREITFTTMGHVARYADEATSGQAEITYRIESQRGEDGRFHDNLVRREDAPIDDDPERGGTLSTVVRDVEKLTFEYWDGEQEIAGDAWERSWDADQETPPKLPTRVRMTIEVQHPHNARQTIRFSSVSDIVMSDPLKILPTDLIQAFDDQLEESEQAAQDALDEAAGVPIEEHESDD